MAYLTPETRRKRRKALCLIIEIICLVHFAIIVPRDRVFTPEKWAHTPDHMRHKLMWSFHRQYQLESMTREEVEKLAKKQAEAENEFRQLGMKENKVKFKKMG